MMIPFPLLSGLLLALAANPPAPVQIRDDFSRDSRKDYQVKGDVTWQKGHMKLGPGAQLSRAVKTSFRAEVRVVVRLEAGPKNAELVLRLQTQQTGSHALEKVAQQRGYAEVALRRTGGEFRLVAHPDGKVFPAGGVLGLSARSGKEEVRLTGTAAAWVVRMHVNWGLLRVKAWPEGTAEPAEWMSVRFSGAEGWVPQLLTVRSGWEAAATLTGLDLVLETPTKGFTPEQQKKAQQVLNTMAEGIMLYTRARYQEAVDKYQQAIRMSREHLPEDTDARGELMFMLAPALLELGDVEGARRASEEGLTAYVRKLGEEHPLAVSMRTNHAGHLFEAGDYVGARRHLEKALADSVRVFGPDDVDTAQCQMRLGDLLLVMGDFATAGQLLETSLKTLEKVGGKGGRTPPNFLSSVGRARLRTSDPARALPLFEEALKRARQDWGPKHPQTSTYLSDLAYALKEAGNPAAARARMEEAVGILLRRAGGKSHPDTARALDNLGVVFHTLGDWPAARAHYEAARAIFPKVLDPDHPDAAKNRCNLAYVLAAEGSARAAWDQLAAGTQSFHRLTSRLLAAGAEREHATLLAQWRPYFEAMLSLVEQTPDLAPARGSDLLRALLDWKSSSGQAVQARHLAFLLGGDAEAARLNKELLKSHRRLVRSLMRPPSARSPQQLRAERDALWDEHNALERKLAERVAAYDTLQKAQQAGPDDIARRLRPGTVLVELVKYRRQDFRAKDRRASWGPARYAALVLSRPGANRPPAVAFAVLGEAGPIDQAVHAWRTRVEKGRTDEATERQLREKVWEPLARALPAGTDRLLVTPDGELGLLPFEAIRLADGRYLIEQYGVSYLSNGRDLMPRPAPKDLGPAVVLSDPDYDAVTDAPPATAVAREAGDQRRSGELDQRGLRWKQLSGIAQEADAVTRAWRAARPGDPLLSLRNRDASEEMLAERKRPRLLYLITHGFFLPDLGLLQPPGGSRNFEIVPAGSTRPPLPFADADPRLRSGLALAGANQWAKRAEKGQSDGLLTALEVGRLDLAGTELVVLSACETGLGEVRVGEGVLGLRRAFQAAGARTVLASLWKVPDAETEQLMTRFFALWLAGKPKAEALRLAQLNLIAEMKKNPKRAAAPPLFWAGFICHGQPE